MRSFRLFSITLSCSLLCFLPATAAERVALVIGNGDYRHGNPLVNPPSDAEDVAAALRQCGFDLVGGGAQTNLTHEAMEKQVESFVAAASKAKVVLFFFAGHGLEVDGSNYMVPVDAQIEEKYQVKHRTLALDQILGAMDGEERLKIVILDCCRNNPLGRGWGRDNVAGLSAPKSTPGGTILLFSAAPGQVAADGRGRNSPFTGVLKEALLKPGDEIEKVFKQVGAQVKAVTGKQQPWMNSSFYGTFAFVPGVTAAGNSGGTGGMVKLTSASPPPSTTRPTVPGFILDEASIGKIIQMKLAGEVTMKFCFCPPGSFKMGSPASEQGREDDEGQVNVCLSQGFWMGQTEVTQGQWKALMGTTPAEQKANGDNDKTTGEVNGVGTEHPMYFVSWADAQAFMAKLNDRVPLSSGWEYALPTEAQWEYACRGGTENTFSFGNTLTSKQANFNGRYPYGTTAKGPYLGQTSAVASYQPNVWGIYDMHGNVWEWCRDFRDVASKLPGGTDPLGSIGLGRVLRGGSWDSVGLVCRSAVRFASGSGHRDGSLGFRVVIVPTGR